MNDQNANQTITIKKYANRRLYNTATSSYVTLEDLSVMVKEGTKFCVYDAKTSEDITRSVLTQIIVEEENKTGQENLLPINFLRQLISFYGDSMQWMVPKYLEHSMDVLSGNQDKIRDYFQGSLGNMFPFGTTLEEMSKQNMAMFENVMKMFSSPLSAFNFGMMDTSSTSSNTTNNSSNNTSTSASSNTTACCSNTSSCNVKSAAKDTSTNNATNNTSNNTTNNATNNKSANNATTSSNTSNTSKASTTSTTNTTTNDSEKQSASVTNLKPRNTETTKTTTATPATTTPMPNVQTATATSSGADDMQQKIANLQRQLADLAKSRA